MKKISILFVALLPILTMAQNTAEAIFGLCPPFPLQTQLVGYGLGDENDIAVVEQYLKMLDKAIKQAESAVDNRAKNSNIEGRTYDIADAQTRHVTGKSISEIQAMGEAGAEKFAKAKANEKLRSIGINKSVGELESQGLSDAEKRQMANSMAQQMSGMSLSELQALAAKMEGMSEEEQAAYIQNSGMLDRIAKNAKKVKPAVSPKVVSELGAQISQSGYNELEVWAERWDKWTKRLPVLEDELDEKWVSMGYYARCKPLYEARAKVPPGFKCDAPYGSAAYEHAAMEAKDKYDKQVITPALNAIKSEYLRTVSLKEWYPFIMEGLSQLKQRTQMIAFDYETLSDYQKEIHNITMAGYAIEYLEDAKKLADFPWGSGDPVEDNN